MTKIAIDERSKGILQGARAPVPSWKMQPLTWLTVLGIMWGGAGAAFAETPTEATGTVTFDRVTFGASTVEITPWEEPSGVEPVEAMASSRMGRLFMDEILPPLFSRTLVLDNPVKKGEEIKWVFTGPRAGLTLDIRSGEVKFLASYYDSFALNPEPVLAGNGQASWFPEKRMSLFKGSIKGGVKSFTIVVHDEMEVELLINGTSISRWMFLEDISRHQLQVAEKNPPKWRMLRPAPTAVEVKVEPNQRHQRMLGWGGITSMPAYHLLNEKAKDQWWDFLRKYGLNIQREYPAGRSLAADMSNLGSLDAAVHHTYADNFPNGETTDFDYLRKHRQLPNSAIWYEYWWHLPEWAKGSADDYAESVVHYCKIVEKRTGRPPEIIGVQNEFRMPNWSEQAPALRKHLDAAGYKSTQIHMNDDSKITDEALEWLKDYQANPAAWDAIDFTATHQYDYRDFHTNPDGFDPILQQWRDLSGGKPFLSTELCVNGKDWQVRSYRMAFIMAEQYYKTLTIADAVAICYCWLLLDVEQPTYNWTRSLMGVDKEGGFVAAPTSHQLRCYGAFSRRVPKGMTRVEVDSGHPDLLATGFLKEDGGATVILINRSSRPLDVRLSGLKKPFKTAERTSATMPNSIDDAYDPRRPARVDPGEILTLTNVRLGLGFDSE